MTKHFLVLLIISVTVFVVGCGDKYPEVNKEELSNFHQSYFQQSSYKNTTDSVDVYIDYSAGMYEAINAHSSFVRELMDMVNSPKTGYYAVGQENPRKIKIDDPKYIPFNAANFDQALSILDLPVKNITNNSTKQSIFITDFELVKDTNKILEVVYEGKMFKSQIDINAWAVNYFEKWLSEGNDIDIIAMPFNAVNNWVPGKETQQQYLYILIFTPKYYVLNDVDNIAIRNRLAKKGYMENKENSQYSFNFSNSNIGIENKYTDKNNGGTNESIVCYKTFADKKGNYEFYEFKSKELLYFISDPAMSDKRIVTKNFIKNYLKCFPEPLYEVKVYDLSKQYSGYYNFINKEPAVFDTDKVTGIVSLVSGDTSKKYELSLPQEESDLLKIIVNKETNEFGITSGQNYSASKETKLYKVDMVIKDAELKMDDALMNKVLQWKDTRGFYVPSLYSSLKEAMERVRKQIKNKVLYTYYFKISE
ncbi:MAG: hypothetical protein ACOYN6_03125 [Ignavibacteria bacterium]